MSVRPRPVTATFPPSPLYSPPARYDHYNLSSVENSTESLLSVLRHSSYESLDLNSEASRSPSRLNRVAAARDRSWSSKGKRHLVSQSRHIESRQALGSARSHDSIAPVSSRSSTDKYGSQAARPTFQSRRSGVVLPINQLNEAPIRSASAPVSARHACSTSPQESSSACNQEGKRLARRTAWEQWVVSKAKEQRQRAEEEAEKKRKKEEIEAKKKAEKEIRRKMGEEKVKQWMNERKESEVKQKQKEKEKLQKKLEEKEETKIRVNAESEVAFQAWLKKKESETAKKKEAEKEKKEKEKEVKEVKKKQNEEKYNNWLKQAQHRPKRKPKETNGVTGFYDEEIYPPPSFVNPVPWHHIEVPFTPDSPVVGKSSRRYSTANAAAAEANRRYRPSNAAAAKRQFSAQRNRRA